MALAALKVWVPAEVLYAADLNNEFSNIRNNPISLISPLTGSIDVDGFDLQDAGEIEFRDESADPTAGGRLRRNGNQLILAMEDARTATTLRPLVVQATSSGTPAASIGTGIEMRGESADENPSVFGALDFSASDVGSGTEDTILSVLLRVAGAAISEAWRFQTTTAFRGTLAHANSAARVYTFPDRSLEVGKADDLTGTLPFAVGGFFVPESKDWFYDDFKSWDGAIAAGAGALRHAANAWWAIGNTSGAGLTVPHEMIVGGDGARGGQGFPSGLNTVQFNKFYAASRNPDLRVRFRQLGASAGNRRVGLLGAQPAGADPTAGVYFRHAAAGTVSLVCRSAGTETTLSTGITAADGVFHTYRFVMTGTTSVALYADGALIGTITTNIPSADLGLAFEGETSTSNEGLGVDYIFIFQDR